MAIENLDCADQTLNEDRKFPEASSVVQISTEPLSFLTEEQRQEIFALQQASTAHQAGQLMASNLM